MTRNLLALTMLCAGVAFAAPVFADNDPSMQQIYDTAKAGHVAQAQQMIEQVLRDHPHSAKAHYVAAELDARQGNFVAARSELSQAEQIDPGLPFAKPESVVELKSEISLTRARDTLASSASETHSFPWAAILLLVGAIAVIWMVFRRRSAPPMQYPGQYPGGMPVGAPPGPYGYGGPGTMPMGGGGIGSGIAGGLASGLAVGAGVVAGEELAHHFLDGDRHAGAAPVPQTPEEAPPNADMGGSDFGVNEPDSWDDSSSGSGGGDFGGGGDDWS
ncbi:MAG: tetratricopeptide repeat protein [Steroidobacteraceae bacterium]